MNDTDWFNANPLRQARIRHPEKRLAKDRQRAVRYTDEFAAEFAQLSPHRQSARRVIVWRIPPDNPAYDPDRPQLIPIPYILLEGEEVVDTDEVLLPLVDQIMRGSV